MIGRQSIAILWVLASVLLALRLAHALRAIAALRARSRRAIIDGSSVLLSDAAGPATIGIRRPEVILPPVVLELDRRLRSLVLRHELEHCARRDPLFLLLAAITLVFYPWNAPAWWVARRLAFAIELDCDARVIQAGDDRARYARLILLFA